MDQGGLGGPEGGGERVQCTEMTRGGGAHLCRQSFDGCMRARSPTHGREDEVEQRLEAREEVTEGRFVVFWYLLNDPRMFDIGDAIESKDESTCGILSDRDVIVRH